MIDDNDPRLTAYVFGELDEKERAIVEQAISQSSELSRAVDEIRQTNLLLTGEFSSEDAIGLSDEQKATLTSAGAGSSRRPMGPSSPSTAKGFVLKYWAWAAAAACLVAIAIPYFPKLTEQAPFAASAMLDTVTESSRPLKIEGDVAM